MSRVGANSKRTKGSPSYDSLALLLPAVMQVRWFPKLNSLSRHGSTVGKTGGQMMRRVLISVLAGVTLMCVAWAATPAEAVISPSPLDCSIENGGCTPLSGVGSLIFG